MADLMEFRVLVANLEPRLEEWAVFDLGVGDGDPGIGRESERRGQFFMGEELEGGCQCLEGEVDAGKGQFGGGESVTKVGEMGVEARWSLSSVASVA